MARRLLAWGIGFLAFRLLCLYFWVDGAWTPEETYRGTIGLEFLRALHGVPLKLPFWCYQADSYLGGSLVTGALAVPFFAAFGVHLASLKLVALTFAGGALLAGYAALFRAYGSAAADTFAALYAFAPPTFVFLGATAMGYHTESALFAVLLAVLADVPHASARRLFAFGLVGGFAFWFSNLNGLAAIAALLACGRAPRPRVLLPLAAGGLLGAAPWFARNLADDFSALRSLADSFEPRAGFAPPGLGKALLLVTERFPLSNGLPVPLAWVYTGCLLASLALCRRHLPPFWRRLLAIYAASFVALYGASHFEIRVAHGDPMDFRYLQSFYALLFLALGIGLRDRRWRVPAAATLVALGLAGLLTQDRAAPGGRAWSYRAVSYADFAAKQMSTCLRAPEALPRLLAWIDSEPEPVRTYLALPFRGAYDYAGLSPSAAVPLANPHFARGWGFSLAVRGEEREALAQSGRLPEIARGAFWRGVAEGIAPRDDVPGLEARAPREWVAFYRSLYVNERACRAGFEPLRASADEDEARGKGASLVECNAKPDRIRNMAEREANGTEFRRALAWGLGWQLRLRHLPDPLRSLDRIHDLPAWAQADALRGALAAERELELPKSESLMDSSY
jgi:hypothetical protein